MFLVGLYRNYFFDTNEINFAFTEPKQNFKINQIKLLAIHIIFFKFIKDLKISSNEKAF